MTDFDHNLSENDWQLIGDGILRGRYNLFLGAGVSLDSASAIQGENCPSAGKLTSILTDLQPRIRAGSSLSRVYKTLTSEQIKQQITDRFRGCSPGATVKALVEFRWSRVFTLNVDDALEAAYEDAQLPMQRPKSFNYDADYKELRDIRQLPIIHLHGFAREDDKNYVFDVSEYARSIRKNNIWSHVLAQKLTSDPFIVAGTSFEESDLAYFLSERSSNQPRTDRPPSILIEPDPDDATLVDCQDHSLKLFSGTTIDFLNEIRRRFPTRPTVEDSIGENIGEDLLAAVGDSKLVAEFHSDFERVPSSEVVSSDGGPLFAYGHPASWADIQSGMDIQRPEADHFVANIAASSAGRTWLLFGEAGAGKTTLLKRTAWNLAQGGRPCFYLRSVGRIRVATAAAVISMLKEKVFIFVDNFADNVSEIADLRRSLAHKDVVFVGSERSYRKDHINKIYGLEYVERFNIGKIGPTTADRLAQSYRNLGLLVPGARSNNKTLIKDEMVAIACCRIINNFEPLHKIISKSMSDATKLENSCYIFMALSSHCYRQGLEYDIASYSFQNYQVDIQSEEATGPLPLKVVDVAGIEFVTPLNEAYSDSILKSVARNSPDIILEAFTGVASAIAPRVNPGAIERGEPCARLASRLFDFDEVVRPLLGIDGAEEFYKRAKSAWDWNSRYWHQIAHMRLDLASREADPTRRLALAELAVQHARFSISIEAKHQFTYTTIGRTIFGKFDVMGRASPDELHEAIGALFRAMKIEQDRKRVTVHPYMILFEGLEREISRGAVLSHDQRTRVRTKILESRYKFSKDTDLKDKGSRLLAVL